MPARSLPNTDVNAAAIVTQKSSFENAIFGSAAPRKRTPSNPQPLVPVGPTSAQPRTSQDSTLEASFKSRTSTGGPVTDIQRPDSPDVGTILANTSRPRRRSSAGIASSALRLRSQTHSSTSPSSWKGKVDTDHGGTPSISDYGVLLEHNDETQVDSEDESRLEGELEGDGSESDSSIDIHTPLPHLMFRDGLLSPRSKLLPQGSESMSPFPYLVEDDSVDQDRSRSVLSVVSTAGSVMTKSGLLYKDPRDTVRRRHRHRDGQLLRAGMGLTTGLGWSDSEDEDAPSTLTRRLIHTSIARKTSIDSSASSRPPSQFSRDSTPADLSHSPPRMLLHGRTPSDTLLRPTSASLSQLSGAADSAASSEVRPTRNRTQSFASISFSSVASSSSSGSSTSLNSGSTNAPQVRRPPRLPKSTEMHALIARQKTQSSSYAPVDPSSPLSSTSLSSTSPRPSLAQSPPRVAKPMALQARVARSRTTSSTSAASSGSVTSLNSPRSFTPSTTSLSAVTSMPRPLRLPRSVSGLSSAVRSTSTPVSNVNTVKGTRPRAEHIRARTLSGSQQPFVIVPAKFAPSASPFPTKPPGTSPLNSPAQTIDTACPSPPLSRSPSPRPRPLVAGPRPKPRTGTGMAYRASSYSSLQATAMRMRSVSMASSSADAGVML
ncbi:hypothetical protein AcV7_003319 [Taiwanofungus camphoratus]|nr:hypothetical protein AcV7_003319 [Antrodia cinnamomea]